MDGRTDIYRLTDVHIHTYTYAREDIHGTTHTQRVTNANKLADRGQVHSGTCATADAPCPAVSHSPSVNVLPLAVTSLELKAAPTVCGRSKETKEHRNGCENEFLVRVVCRQVKEEGRKRCARNKSERKEQEQEKETYRCPSLEGIKKEPLHQTLHDHGEK
jgi:hypothetical protein